MKRNEYLINHWKVLTQDLPTLKHNYLQLLLSLYQAPYRCYHNLTHIKSLYTIWTQYQHLLVYPKSLQFAIWYHDAIYQPTQSNNEENSAQLAKIHLSSLQLPPTLINQCCQYILATKTHTLPIDIDTVDAQFMLDIDLSILGAEPRKYKTYIQQIRKEYQMYPDRVYKEGRIKVLGQFLKKQFMYHTEFMREQYEEQARQNMNAELKRLLDS